MPRAPDRLYVCGAILVGPTGRLQPLGRWLANIAKMHHRFKSLKLMAEPSSADRLARAFLHHAEVRAERLIAWLRIATAFILLAVALAGTETQRAIEHVSAFRVLWPSAIIAIGFLFTSAIALLLLKIGRYKAWMGACFASIDVLLALSTLAQGAAQYGLPGNYLFLLPSASVAGLVVAFNALRYRLRIVVGTTVLYVVGAIFIAREAGFSISAAQPPNVISDFAGLAANSLRLAVVGLSGAILALAVYRGRLLLVRILREGQARQTLTRFLPSSVVADLTNDSSRLRNGVIVDCVVLFVDMRGSTAIAEAMEPHRVADFLTRFRRRITRSVDLHGGLIEKYTGDGALVVFGAPNPKDDDAARALACALNLIAAIDEWNDQRDASSSLSIVVGLHAGPCFCGVVGGEEARLEFTVIGDPVNVAARLEKIAKDKDLAIVASRTVLTRADANLDDGSWRALGTTAIRGREEPVEIFSIDTGIAAAHLALASERK